MRGGVEPKASLSQKFKFNLNKMGVIVTVRRIGSSLGVIFPKAFADERGLRERDQVEIETKPVRTIDDLEGILRQWGTPPAAELNRLTNEGEEL